MGCSQADKLTQTHARAHALGGQGSPGEALVTFHPSVLLLMVKQKYKMRAETADIWCENNIYISKLLCELCISKTQ